MKSLIRLLAICAGLLVAGTAVAGPYPDRPVRLVVGFAAGGPTDVIARIVAEKLSASLGQQFYVEDKPGAGSNIASAEVAKGAPDGYTLTVVSTGFMVNMSLYAHVPYDAVKDFAPITMVAYSPNVLVTNPSVPAKSVKELIALIKANPGKYSFAGPGIGSTPHLSGELFKQKFGLEMVHVPYPGAAPAITSTIGGHTPIAFTALPPALANIKDGKLRALALLAVKRSKEIPDVPTMAGGRLFRPGSRHPDRRIGAGRHAEGDHRPAASRDRQGGGPTRCRGPFDEARLRAGGQQAGGVRLAHQERDREVGQGGARRASAYRMTPHSAACCAGGRIDSNPSAAVAEMVVRTISRASCAGHGRPRCIVARLSHITTSPAFHVCT